MTFVVAVLDVHREGLTGVWYHTFTPLPSLYCLCIIQLVSFWTSMYVP